MNCAQCGKFEAYVIETRLRVDGTRYRRYACQRCSHRWSVYQKDAAPSRKTKRKRDYVSKHLNRQLTSYEAAEIMMSDLPLRELAKKYSITHQCVSAIKTGKTYKELYQALHPH